MNLSKGQRYGLVFQALFFAIIDISAVCGFFAPGYWYVAVVLIIATIAAYGIGFWPPRLTSISDDAFALTQVIHRGIAIPVSAFLITWYSLVLSNPTLYQNWYTPYDEEEKPGDDDTGLSGEKIYVAAISFSSASCLMHLIFFIVFLIFQIRRRCKSSSNTTASDAVTTIFGGRDPAANMNRPRPILGFAIFFGICDVSVTVPLLVPGYWYITVVLIAASVAVNVFSIRIGKKPSVHFVLYSLIYQASATVMTGALSVLYEIVQEDCAKYRDWYDSWKLSCAAADSSGTTFYLVFFIVGLSICVMHLFFLAAVLIIFLQNHGLFVKLFKSSSRESQGGYDGYATSFPQRIHPHQNRKHQFAQLVEGLRYLYTGSRTVEGVHSGRVFFAQTAVAPSGVAVPQVHSNKLTEAS